MSGLSEFYNLFKASVILATGSLAGSFAIIVDGVNVKFKFDFEDFSKEINANNYLSAISEGDMNKVKSFFKSIKRNITKDELKNYYRGIKDIKVKGKTVEHISYVICHTGLTILKVTKAPQKSIEEYEEQYNILKVNSKK